MVWVAVIGNDMMGNEYWWIAEWPCHFCTGWWSIAVNVPMYVNGKGICSEQRLGPGARSTLKCEKDSVFSSIRSVHFLSFFCYICQYMRSLLLLWNWLANTWSVLHEWLSGLVCRISLIALPTLWALWCRLNAFTSPSQLKPLPCYILFVHFFCSCSTAEQWCCSELRT